MLIIIFCDIIPQIDESVNRINVDSDILLSPKEIMTMISKIINTKIKIFDILKFFIKVYLQESITLNVAIDFPTKAQYKGAERPPVYTKAAVATNVPVIAKAQE